NAPPAGAPGVFVRQVDTEVQFPYPLIEGLEVWEFHVDWESPSLSTFVGPTHVAVTGFDSTVCAGMATFSCIPQPSGLDPLDSMAPFMMYRLQYRNVGDQEALGGNFTVDVPGTDVAGVRWFELRRTAN